MAKKKEKSQPPEIPKSTENWEVLPKEKIDELLKKTEKPEEVTVPSEVFKDMVGSLLAEAESAPGPLEDHIDKFGDLAPEDADMAIALQHEGITPAFLARKLKIILSAYEPKWNQKKNRWDYFIPSELWRRCIEMSMKVRGDYAPEKRINIEIDGSLEELLRVSKGISPEEAKAKIIEYIDVEVIKEKE